MEPRPARTQEWQPLLDWLDDGLRAGRRGRLASEFPTHLRPENAADQWIVRQGGRFAAHAMARIAEAEADGVRLRVGMIGHVYTDPAFRGRGLGGGCVEACVEALRRGGAQVAVLWSDKHDFYAKLGFEPAGVELHARIGAALCARATRGDPALRVEAAREEDFAALESLYESKPAHAIRPRGALATLATAPDCRLLVARRAGEPVAYAARGRGDDFADVVHEWAGEPAALALVLRELVGERESVGILSGPADEPGWRALRASGADPQPGCFALARLLDAPEWWTRLAAARPELREWTLQACDAGFHFEGPTLAVRLSHRETLDLLLGPDLPSRLAAALPRGERSRLCGLLPCPLYLWGFDSI